jgi:hypothetical protein
VRASSDAARSRQLQSGISDFMDAYISRLDAVESLDMKIAIKLLSDSDLSLFEGHAAHAGQRAIELEANVFLDSFYPGLRSLHEQVAIPLVVSGPGGGGAHRLTREIQRARGLNRWCLGGERIHDPAGKSGLYATLTVGDYGIFAFDGDTRPIIVTLVLVSARDDPRLHEAITARCGFTARNSMVVVPGLLISELRVVSGGAYSGEHPLDVLGFRDTVEQVLFGDMATARSLQLPSDGLMSHDDLRQQLQSAEEFVQWGEELFGTWLVASGHCEEEFEWISQTHVRSVFDYEVRSAKWIDGAPSVCVCEVDARTFRTATAFDRRRTEIRSADGKLPYRAVVCC